MSRRTDHAVILLLCGVVFGSWAVQNPVSSQDTTAPGQSFEVFRTQLHGNTPALGWAASGELYFYHLEEEDHWELVERSELVFTPEEPPRVQSAIADDRISSWSDHTGLWVQIDGFSFQLDPTPASRVGPDFSFGEDVYSHMNADRRLVSYLSRGGIVVYTVPPPEFVASQPSALISIYGGETVLGLDQQALERHIEACRQTGSSRCAEPNLQREVPAVPVEVAPFRIEQTEVNRSQYQRCVDAGMCPAIDESSCQVFTGERWETGVALPPEATQFNMPRTCVTQPEATAYCAYIGRRLPTEAEWQAAAGGSEQRVFAWGDEWLSENANYKSEDAALEHVYSRATGQTPQGVFNLSGNAYEWVSDRRCDLTSWPIGSDRCLAEDGEAVVRGGSFVSHGGALRTTYRRYNQPDTRVDTHGFRCAAEPLSSSHWCERVRVIGGALDRPRCLQDDLGTWGLATRGVWDFDGEGAGHYVAVRVEADGRESATSFETFVSDGDGWYLGYESETTRDIDGDGRPELLVQLESYSTLNMTKVFTYDNGEVVELDLGIPDGFVLNSFLDADQDGELDMLLLSPPAEIGYLPYRHPLLAHNTGDGDYALWDETAMKFNRGTCEERTDLNLEEHRDPQGVLDAYVCGELLGTELEGLRSHLRSFCEREDGGRSREGFCSDVRDLLGSERYYDYVHPE